MWVEWTLTPLSPPFRSQSPDPSFSRLGRGRGCRFGATRLVAVPGPFRPWTGVATEFWERVGGSLKGRPVSRQKGLGDQEVTTRSLRTDEGRSGVTALFLGGTVIPLNSCHHPSRLSETRSAP